MCTRTHTHTPTPTHTHTLIQTHVHTRTYAHTKTHHTHTHTPIHTHTHTHTHTVKLTWLDIILQPFILCVNHHNIMFVLTWTIPMTILLCTQRASYFLLLTMLCYIQNHGLECNSAFSVLFMYIKG